VQHAHAPQYCFVLTVPLRPALRYTRTRAGDGPLYLLYSRAIRDWAIISSRQWTDGSAILGLPLRAQSGGNDPSALCPDTADWTHNHTTPYGQATFEPASAVALVTEHLCSRPVASISDCAVARAFGLDVSPWLWLLACARRARVRGLRCGTQHSARKFKGCV